MFYLIGWLKERKGLHFLILSIPITKRVCSHNGGVYTLSVYVQLDYMKIKYKLIHKVSAQ